MDFKTYQVGPTMNTKIYDGTTNLGPSSDVIINSYLDSYNQVQNTLENVYNQMSEHSNKKRPKEIPLMSGINSISNRIKRLNKEKFIIVPQNKYEQLTTYLTAIIIILSITIAAYMYFNDLIIADASAVSNSLTAEQQEKIYTHGTLKKTYNIINGIGGCIVVILATYRIYQRTTI